MRKKMFGGMKALDDAFLLINNFKEKKSIFNQQENIYIFGGNE